VPVFDGNGFDQRGATFVRTYGARTDVGAFEWQPAPVLPPPPPGELPETGTGSGETLMVAMLLLVVGGLLTSVRRRPATVTTRRCRGCSWS